VGLAAGGAAPEAVRNSDRGHGVSIDLITELTVFALAIFVGFEVISKVPTMLHTPLMSGTNAIHGIVIVGAILVVGDSLGGTLSTVFGVIAVIFGTVNVVGGFLVTDRMLQMFKRRPAEQKGK
jgi:NAD(P) transhydrogenase subunit alpha